MKDFAFVNAPGCFPDHGSVPRHFNKNTLRSLAVGSFAAEENVSGLSACQWFQRPSLHSLEIRAIRVPTALQARAATRIQSLWGANAANLRRIQPCAYTDQSRRARKSRPLTTLTRADTTDELPAARQRLAPRLTLLFVNASGHFQDHGSFPRHLNKNTTRSLANGGIAAEENR